MRDLHRSKYSAEENFQRTNIVVDFIKEANNITGQSSANQNSGSIFEQAESWMGYLWFIATPLLREER